MNSAYSDGQGLNCSAERIIQYILLLDKVSALELARYWGAKGWKERDRQPYPGLRELPGSKETSVSSVLILNVMWLRAQNLSQTFRFKSRFF